MRAFLFPGQGTQRVGMGQAVHHAYAEARRIFDLARDLLGYDLREICFRGPPQRLTATEHAQPAIFTCSAAVLEILRHRDVHPDAAAGHSVGEFTALYAAEVLTFEETLRAVRRRAELMAGTRTSGTMAAVVGLSEAETDAICARSRSKGAVVIALHNAPRYFVVSGAASAVEHAVELAREAGALKVTPLVVSHAFHSPLMDEIAFAWRDYVADLPLRKPSVPVALNTTGGLAWQGDEIRRAIVDQLTNRVRWVDCMQALVGLGVNEAVEVGESKVLVNLMRNISRRVETHSLNGPRAVEQFTAEALTSSVSGGSSRVV